MLKFFRIPFATSGDKTAVPDAADVNGNVSYAQGYGFDYQRPKTDPAAKDIERDKTNGVLFDITTALAELQSQGIPDFITSVLNGGAAYSYAQFAVVRYSGDLYISLDAANTALPTDATKWAKLPTPARVQSAEYVAVVAGGTADALTGAFSPAIAALPAAPGTLSVLVRAGAANATTTPTFKADGTAAKTIVKGNNIALAANDIAGAGHWLDLQYDATLDKWVLRNPANGLNPGITQAQADARYLNNGYLLARDEKAQNTAGGGCTAGQTVARTLNTLSANTIVGASLAANQITLPAGTYRIDASAPTHSVDESRISLYNVTDAAVQILGTSENGITNVVTRSFLKGRFTIAAPKVFELRHYTGTTIATNGFGLPVNSGGVEVYTQVEIIKEA